MAIRSDLDLPGSRPATRYSAHEYFTISGRGHDPRGEVTRTLDDASESWTKANCENAGAVPTRGYRDKGCWWERAVEPSMGPLRDLVFMAHTAAPFSFVSPPMDMYRLLLVLPTSCSTSRLPLRLLLCQPRRDSSFPASSYSALVSGSTSAQ